MYLDDTIAAISTPPGIGGIGIIRISGYNSIEIVDKIYLSPKSKRLEEVKSHTINYGYIKAIDNDEKIIDEVLISVMKEPNTFTKENIVEINCHGGYISTKTVLEEVLKAGARLAGPGEFSKRAFLNGRIDLSQAEAIIDIINSKTNIQMSSAVNHLKGKLSAQIEDIRETLLKTTAQLQASVDFPEYEIEELQNDTLFNVLKTIKDEINGLLDTSEVGKIIREGLKTIIIGKPNVGKSSLLNAMLKEKRAIVTEIPGTTRDIIEEYINISGIPLKIIDTAGIRDTDEIIEKIGVEKTLVLINDSDLIIFMLDGSLALSDEDHRIIRLIKDKNIIVLINKSDLDTKIDYNFLKENFNEEDIINISVIEGTGLDKLEKKIKDMYYSGRININNDIIITNIRHKEALEKTKINISNAIESLTNNIPTDIISIDIYDAIENLGEIVGMTVSEEVVDKIFHDFCIGK